MASERCSGPEISDAVKEKTAAAKAFIEDKYECKREEHKRRQEALEYLEKRMEELGVSEGQREALKKELMHVEAEKKRQLRQKQTIRQYEPVKIIGRGAFGEVRLCRCLRTESLVAVKKMRKRDMVKKNQVSHVKAERDVLAKTKNPYIVNLRSSFQDDANLYLVMDYHPGGDLMTLLIRKDILSEEESRFYIAELVGSPLAHPLDSGGRERPQTGLHPPRPQARQHPSRLEWPRQTVGLRAVQARGRPQLLTHSFRKSRAGGSRTGTSR